MTLQPSTIQLPNMMTGAPRRVFMVLSPRSLSYARFALESLFRNVAEPIHLYLITDSLEDRANLEEELSLRQQTDPHTWSVYAEEDLADYESSLFARMPNLRQFRRGHPCWRKITDPVLLSAPGEEMVILDPDLYFPNRFRFEKTPHSGVLLMWQKPHCLWPPEVVKAAMQADVAIAHHVDIGVAHWRAPLDLEWIEWLLTKLNGPQLPLMMHVEAILWSAIAMQFGGGYLDPGSWHCWQRGRYKQARIKLGTPGIEILRKENFSRMKCFHAGGEAKYWLADAKTAGLLDREQDRTEASPLMPFVELPPQAYYRQQQLGAIVRKLRFGFTVS
jgi:hypothetical protein